MDIFLILVLGLSIGSFMNVCIYRIAREESIIFPASHCTSCGYQLGYRDLVPIISYITLRGKCRNCNERISIRYLLVEIINGLLYILMYFKFGFTLELIKFCLFTSLIVVIAFIDIETKYVYKFTINFGLVFGILFCILKFIRGNSIPRDNILGAFIGFGIIYTIVILTKGMGDGDSDIALICGLFLGAKGIVLSLFIAIVLAGISSIIFLIFKIKNIKSQIAFGPYLAIGSIISCLYCTDLISIYFNLFLN